MVTYQATEESFFAAFSFPKFKERGVSFGLFGLFGLCSFRFIIPPTPALHPWYVFSVCKLLLTDQSLSNPLHSQKVAFSITNRNFRSRWNLHYWWLDRNANWFQKLTIISSKLFLWIFYLQLFKFKTSLKTRMLPSE